MYIQVAKTTIVLNISSKAIGPINVPHFLFINGIIICIGTKNCRAYVRHIPKPAASFTA